MLKFSKYIALYFPKYRVSLMKSFPVSFEREGAINIAVSTWHLSPQNGLEKF